jgi:hypothetical protein
MERDIAAEMIAVADNDCQVETEQLREWATDIAALLEIVKRLRKASDAVCKCWDDDDMWQVSRALIEKLRAAADAARKERA